MNVRKNVVPIRMVGGVSGSGFVKFFADGGGVKDYQFPLPHRVRLKNPWEQESPLFSTKTACPPGQDFHCEYCPRKYSSLSALRVHKSRLHRNQVHRDREGTLVCGLCRKKTFFSRELLLNHLADAVDNGGHELPVKIQSLWFESEAEFEQWKTETELLSGFQFVRTNGRRRARVKGVEFKYFQCHRSRVSRGSKRSSSKLCFTCPTFCVLALKDQDGTCEIKFCTEHYGHEEEVRRLQVPAIVRDRVLELLQLGLSDQMILEQMAEEWERAEEWRVPTLIGSLRRGMEQEPWTSALAEADVEEVDGTEELRVWIQQSLQQQMARLRDTDDPVLLSQMAQLAEYGNQLLQL